MEQHTRAVCVPDTHRAEARVQYIGWATLPCCSPMSPDHDAPLRVRNGCLCDRLLNAEAHKIQRVIRAMGRWRLDGLACRTGR